MNITKEQYLEAKAIVDEYESQDHFEKDIELMEDMDELEDEWVEDDEY